MLTPDSDAKHPILAFGFAFLGSIFSYLFDHPEVITNILTWTAYVFSITISIKGLFTSFSKKGKRKSKAGEKS